ncbi:ArsR/SmtB family transcription factor [Leekyejoonella antrihumi]|uniref:Helix-turn-helix transcriptional regulator n=1 Tax=Leekyejoonella antrihumi TaxID=1660198 RepID=A0A563DYS3_9MICO|nr:helix-turn-helix domain-containing protein [Leekyejoonella antrihumi]TWP35279.1 helix-turn-helix transcriptional regulator [Leekyejoonella antrihumi]
MPSSQPVDPASHGPARTVTEIFPDTNQLKVLAHPMRLRILGILRRDGPATATQLAQRLGLNSGATSYHLRQLAQHGLISDDETRGNARDRWWRATHETTRVEPAAVDDPAARAAVGAFNRTVALSYVAELQASLDERADLPREWADVIDDSDWNIWLTPAQVNEALERIHAILDELHRAAPAWSENPPDRAVLYTVQLHGFPRPGKIARPDET